MQNYWQKRHENYCLQWLSATTKQQYYLYNKLHPALITMAEIIQNRYFSIPFTRQREYLQNVLQDVFLRLPNYQPEKGSAYSFCSMTIKHQFYYLVTLPKNTRTLLLEYVDSYESVDTSESMYDEKQEIDVEAVYKQLQTRRAKLIAIVRQEEDNLRSIPIIKAGQLIQTLDLCIEYLLRFKNFNIYCLKEYVENNSLMSKSTISNHFGELFHEITHVKKSYKPRNKPLKTSEDKRAYNENYRNTHKAYYANWRKTHKAVMAKHNHNWYVKRGKKLQQERRKSKKNDNNTITNNATPINGSLGIGMLHSIPVNNNTGNKEISVS